MERRRGDDRREGKGIEVEVEYDSGAKVGGTVELHAVETKNRRTLHGRD